MNRSIRRRTSGVAVVAGVGLSLFAALSTYVEDHFRSESGFISNTAHLADNDRIVERLFDGFRAEIDSLRKEASASNSEAGSTTDWVLPSEAGLTDEPKISTGVDQQTLLIERILSEVLDSPLYQRSFLEASMLVHDQILQTAAAGSIEPLDQQRDVVFDLRALYPLIYERLSEDPRTASITRIEVPYSFGRFKIADRSTTHRWVWQIVDRAASFRYLATGGAIAALIFSVGVAVRRPSTMMQFGVGLLGIGALSILAVLSVRALVPLLTATGTDSASVGAVYLANTFPLLKNLVGLVALGAILSIGGWLARLIWPDTWVYSRMTHKDTHVGIRRRAMSDPKSGDEHHEFYGAQKTGEVSEPLWTDRSADRSGGDPNADDPQSSVRAVNPVVWPPVDQALLDDPDAHARADSGDLPDDAAGVVARVRPTTEPPEATPSPASKAGEWPTLPIGEDPRPERSSRG